MNDKQFRFQDLVVWKKGAEISSPLFELADNLEKRRLNRFAERLRGATLSITNNIAEGSGSASAVDFAHYLNMARRSVYEVANMLMLFARENYCQAATTAALIRELEEQSRMLLAFRLTLKS